MPLPTIAGVVRCSVRGTNVAGQQWVNVVHVQHGNPGTTPSQADISALDLKFVRLWSGAAYSTGTAWLASCSSDTKIADITYYPLDGTSSPTVQSHIASGTLPISTNQATEVAHVLTLRTGQRGRRNRGRIYLPAASTSAMSGTQGTLNATNLSNTLTQVNGLQADLATIQWFIVVASYGKGQLHGAPQTWAPYATVVNQFTMDAVPDVQRRRKL